MQLGRTTLKSKGWCSSVGLSTATASLALPYFSIGWQAAGNDRDVLGSSVNYQQHDIGVMDRNAVRLLLVARTERLTGPGSCYVYMDDADALHAELVAKGADVQGEPVSRRGR